METTRGLLKAGPQLKGSSVPGTGIAYVKALRSDKAEVQCSLGHGKVGGSQRFMMVSTGLSMSQWLGSLVSLFTIVPG